MQYRSEKDFPKPGKLTNIDTQEISFVDRAANNYKFLTMKGMDMELEEFRKSLETAGLKKETIESVIKEAGGNSQGELTGVIETFKSLDKTQKQGVLSYVGKIFGLGNDPAPEPVKKESPAPATVAPPASEPLTLDAISKMFDEKITKAVAEVKKETSGETPEPDIVDVAKENEDLEKQIQKAEQEDKTLLIQKNQELKKKLDLLQKSRTGGNGSNNEGQSQQNLSPIQKKYAQAEATFG